jgi:hypothetical protein
METIAQRLSCTSSPKLEGLMEERLYNLLQKLYRFDESGLIKDFAREYFGLERMPDETGS